MNLYKQALLIGDNQLAPYHPLHQVETIISDILGTQMKVSSSEDYEMLREEHLLSFQLCISYTDCWNRKATPEQTAGLLSFVSKGGGLVVIHNGISLQNKPELRQLIGARFTGHPAYQKLDFRLSAPEHVIMQNIPTFTIEDEPYQFDFDPFTEMTVLFEYEFEERHYPAAWAIEYGLGRVVYLMPGHNASSFSSEAYRKIIENSCLWCTKIL